MAEKTTKPVGLWLLCLALAAWLAPCPCLAADWDNCSGTFSNVYFHEEAGDVLGIELRIIPDRHVDPDRYQGMLVICQGVPGDMIVVHPTCDGSTMRFTFPDSQADEAAFTGTVTKQGLEGTVTYSNGVTKQWSLPRGKGFWD